ncbi:MAG: hypothetical protein JNL80_15750 [Phycisphaerae bacterium]|nr:hypothetical protein [Phycisphaerae bacterium]
MTSTYAFLAVALIVSTIGFGMLVRGARTLGRRRHRQCIACGHPLHLPLAAATQTTVALCEVCTECGRHPDLDRHAHRGATSLVALGIAAQFVWILLGATRWPAAAVLLVETSVALVAFALEPLASRQWRRRVAAGAESSTVPSLPRRPVLRTLSLLVVTIGWSWIFARTLKGYEIQSLIAAPVNNAPTCWLMISSQTEWMNLLMPPGIVRYARTSGIIVSVSPATSVPLAPEVNAFVEHAWIEVPLGSSYDLVDFSQVRELSVTRLTDVLLEDELSRFPPMPALRTLDLDNSSLSPAAIERLLQRVPNLEALRVNYLDRAEADLLRAKYPHLHVDSAEIYRRDAHPQRRTSDAASSELVRSRA